MFGTQWIEVVEADPSASDLTKHIQERGSGPFEIVLAGSLRNAEPLPLDRTHGARIRFEDAETLAR
jgi:hypothetical protein